MPTIEIVKNPIRIKFLDKKGLVLNKDETFGIGWIGE
jgi:hypothetical protein